MGVVHLKAGVELAMRKGELGECMELQGKIVKSKNDKVIDDSILLGDFNFRDGFGEPIEDEPLLENGYTDLWQHTHPSPEERYSTNGKK